jgi:hypothetical protein
MIYYFSDHFANKKSPAKSGLFPARDRKIIEIEEQLKRSYDQAGIS